MPAWAPFLAVALSTLAAVLVLARLSQNTLEEYAPGQSEERETDSTRGRFETDAPSRQRDGLAADQSDTGALADTVLNEQPGDSPVDSSVYSSTDPAGEPIEAHPPSESSTTERRHETQLELTPRVLLANVAFTQAMVVLVLALSAWYFEIPAEAFGIAAEASNSGLPAVGFGVAFGVVLWIANELSTRLADVVGAAYDERVREMLAPESPVGWLVLFGGVLPLIAAAEELMFRAALIGVPEAAYGIEPVVLAVASSFAFALGHGAQGRVGVVVTGTLGLVLAAGYVYTGSLLVVIVAHYVINALEFLVHELLEVGELV